jgi:hypothetical protein
VVTLVPVTSNTERSYPFRVLLRRPETGLDRDSKAQAEQVRSVSAERAGARLGQVPAAVMTELDQALRTHLGLQPGNDGTGGRIPLRRDLEVLPGQAPLPGPRPGSQPQPARRSLRCFVR